MAQMALQEPTVAPLMQRAQQALVLVRPHHSLQALAVERAAQAGVVQDPGAPQSPSQASRAAAQAVSLALQTMAALSVGLRVAPVVPQDPVLLFLLVQQPPASLTKARSLRVVVQEVWAYKTTGC